jgi:hypothetical protein
MEACCFNDLLPVLVLSVMSGGKLASNGDEMSPDGRAVAVAELEPDRFNRLTKERGLALAGDCGGALFAAKAGRGCDRIKGVVGSSGIDASSAAELEDTRSSIGA